MKVFSVFRGTAVASILSPTLASPLFDVITHSILAIIFVAHSTQRHWETSNIDLRSRRAFYTLFCVLLASYLANHLYGALMRSNDALSGDQGVKMLILGVSTVVLLGGTYILVSSLKVTEEQKANFLVTMVYAGGISALVTIVFWVAETGATFDRYNFVPPITGSQGLHLYYMAITVLFAIALFVNKSMLSRRTRLLTAIAGGLAIFSIATVMVREGWLIFATAVSITWFIISPDSRRVKTLKLILGGGLILFGMFTAFQLTGSVADLIGADGGNQGESVLIRISMIENALRVIQENPVFGVGYGNFPLVVSHAVELESGTKVEVASPHNALVLLMSEAGVFGLVSIVFVCYSILVSARARLNRSYGPVTRAMAASFYPLLLLLCLDQFISNSLFIPPPAERQVVQFSYLIWTSIGVLLAQSGDQRS